MSDMSELKAPIVENKTELTQIILNPGEIITVYLYTPADHSIGKEQEWSQIQLQVTHLGKHQIFCDDLDLMSFTEWERMEKESTR